MHPKKRICHRAAAPKLKKRKNALNTPGAWHFMISYTQRSDRAIVLATKLEKDLAHRGYSVWLDVNMNDKSEAAMKEAVEHSMVVLALITGGAPNLDDDNAYLKRAFCLSELRWAFSAITDPNLPLKHLQPLVRMDDKRTTSPRSSPRKPSPHPQESRCRRRIPEAGKHAASWTACEGDRDGR